MADNRIKVLLAPQDETQLQALYPGMSLPEILRHLACERLEKEGIVAESRHIQRGGVRDLPSPRKIQRKRKNLNSK
jgi:hypothetical protein